MVQDSSTPNEMVRTTSLKKTGNDSCFGFEEVSQLLVHLLFFSLIVFVILLSFEHQFFLKVNLVFYVLL
jgi:hypothetical protein